MKETVVGELIRNCYWETGTYGVLTLEGVSFQTVERPWLGNARFVSCIPDGQYTVKRHVSPKFGACWILLGESVFASEEVATKAGRYNVLIHAANWPDQLQGCIAVGQTKQIMPHPKRTGLEAIGVTASVAALKQLSDLLAGVQEWRLEIKGFRT